MYKKKNNKTKKTENEVKLPPKPRKKISRKKPEEKSKKNYFDEVTDDSIVKYQKAVILKEDGTIVPDYEARNKIYLYEILPAFNALVDNLINVYGFRVAHESRTDLKNECLEFLYTVLPKFKKERGTKAFSYFNIIAKRWLIVESKKNIKLTQNYVSMDNKDAMSKHDLYFLEEHNTLQSIEEILTKEDISKNLKEIVIKLKDKVKTENEKLTIEAIAFLSENLEETELLSKRAVMVYIREMTKLSSKQLSIALSSLKKQYKIVKEDFFR